MFTIILNKPRNPLNVGTAARAMANFGLSDLRLVDVYAPLVAEIKTAVGAEGLLKKTKFFDTLQAALADCNYTLATTSLKNRALEQEIVPLPELPAKIKGGLTGIVFGQEKTGLTNDEIALCNAVLNIPVSVKTPSINLGQAVTLACYELSKKTNVKTVRRSFTPATTAENELLVREAEIFLKNNNFRNAVTAKDRQNMLRAMLSQTALTKKQVFMIKSLLAIANKNSK